MLYVGGKEMKDWALHRFDEVFDLQMGKTPDRKTPDYFGGDNVWVSIRDMVKKEIFDSNEHITDEAVTATNIRKVKKGTVIMSFKLTVGKCAIAARDLYTNEAIMAFNLKEGFDISPDFLYYYLQGYKWEGANKAVMGLTLNKAIISQHKIGFPSLSEQLSIVSELNKINELIGQKKSQMSDLEMLELSIFYDMFGDPVENEKGWEVKTFGELGTIERGAGISKKDFVDEGLPCIHYGQLHTILGPTTKRHYASIPKSLLPKYKIAHTGDLIMAITSEDVEGSCKSTAWLGDYDIVIGSDAAILHHEQNGTFLSYYTMTKAFFNEKAKYAKGFKVTHISTKEIESIPVYLPPLSLQQEFANRIEAIDKQKQKIISTINELETLLASRMQYWFD